MPIFRFMLHSNSLERIEGTSAYKIPSEDIEAPTVEEAWKIMEPKIPEGAKLFCWYEVLDKPNQIEV